MSVMCCVVWFDLVFLPCARRFLLPEAERPGQLGEDKMSDLPHYEEPEWAGMPAHDFSFDVIKGGVVLPNLSLTKAGKSYVTMGRLASCDFVVEHPSLSRLHAGRWHESVVYIVER